MKSVSIFFIFILTIIGCSSDKENPVSGKLYVFKSVPDLPKAYNEKIIFEYLAFLDEESFILSYSEDFQHRFVRGNFQVKNSYVYLQFENHAYEVYYPEIVATSAVDTTQFFRPVITKSKWKYSELKMKLSIDKNAIRLDKTGMEQMGEIYSDVSIKDFIGGIKLQDLEFMLETETIQIVN